jgi:two-component system chemotaxis response regulator CheB
MAVAADARRRRSLRAALVGDDLELIAVVGADAPALARAGAQQPQVVVVDAEFAAGRWSPFIAALRQAAPECAVVAAVRVGADGLADEQEARAAGADGATVCEDSEAANAALLECVRASVRAAPRSANRPAPRAAPPSLHSTAVRPVAPQAPRANHPASEFTLARLERPARIECVAIGVSTGGPNALAVVLPSFPADFPLPILIVQHMPPVFTSNLAQSLQLACKLRVREAAEGDLLEPGCVLIAPGDFHMLVKPREHGAQVALQQGPPENFCRPAVDVLFRSVAELYGASTLAVVLTGMGQDGLLGVQRIRAAGGQVVVQDEATSVVWGMPGAVARAGLANAVIPLQNVAAEVLRRSPPTRLAKGA